MALQEEDIDKEMKVIIVGNGQVGKTSMITRFAQGVWTDEYKKTIGTDFMEKDVFIRSQGDSVKLHLWDTAGQEMFSQLTKNYYRGASAVVYVFSTVDRASFLEIPRWKEKVEAECGDIPSVLVQNKCDLIDQSVVQSVEVEDMAGDMGVRLYRASVKKDSMINELFEQLAEEFLTTSAGNMTIAAVPDIGDVSRVKTKSASNDEAGLSKPHASSNHNNNNNSKSSGHGGDGGTFKLKVSKKRTQGKKSMCTLL